MTIAIDDDNYLTVKEVAEVLKVSEQTIKRRIRTKEYKGEKRPLPGNQFMWVMHKSQVHGATQTIEVAPMTRQVSVVDIQEAVRTAVAEAVGVQLEDMEERLQAKLDEKFSEHYRLVDERLRQVMNNKQQPIEAPKETKSIWQRIFG